MPFVAISLSCPLLGGSFIGGSTVCCKKHWFVGVVKMHNDYRWHSVFLAPSEPPINLVLVDIEARSFSLHWEPPPPESVNGIIRKYIINITIPDMGETMVYSSYNMSLNVHGLHPYTIHHISVSAFTISAGPYTEILDVETEEDSKFCILLLK